MQLALILPFVIVPFIFSHIGIYFGFMPNIPSSYERIKVQTFFILLIYALFCWFLYARSEIQFKKNRDIFLLVWIILWCFGIYLNTLPYPIDLIGTYEKYHGTLYYGSGIIFFLLLSWHIHKKIDSNIKKWILVTGILVSSVAILQLLGWDPLQQKYSHGGWDISRIFGTLWNPNYLAGYLLMIVPFIFTAGFPKITHFWIYILFSGVICATGSVTGIILLGLYSLHIFIAHFCKKQKTQFIIWSILFSLFSSIIVWKYDIFQEKILSLQTRFAIWENTTEQIIQNPRILFFWNWPDSMASYTSRNDHRNENLKKYIQASDTLDSAHNIFLDIWFSFWIFGLIWFIIALWIPLRYTSKEKRDSILLFIGFFIFNIPVISHFILLIYALVPLQKDKKNPQ